VNVYNEKEGKKIIIVETVVKMTPEKKTEGKKQQ
jgi:hypothetical protein